MVLELGRLCEMELPALSGDRALSLKGVMKPDSDIF